MPLSLDIKTFSLSTSIVTAAVLFTAGCDGASLDAQPDEQAVAPTLLDTPSLFCGEYEFTDDETGATIFRPEVYYPIALKKLAQNTASKYGRRSRLDRGRTRNVL